MNRIYDRRGENRFCLGSSSFEDKILVMRNATVVALLLLMAASSVSVLSEQLTDISGVAAAGSVKDNRYTNSYFKLTVDAHDGTYQLNPVLDTVGKRARLVQVLFKPTTLGNGWAFAVLADALIAHPGLQSSSIYVRSFRHQMETQGDSTVRAEFPVAISGVQFTGAITLEPEPSGLKHYRGFYSAFREDYVLSFDVGATTEIKINDLISHMVTFTK
jgi:hypothetical protein